MNHLPVRCHSGVPRWDSRAHVEVQWHVTLERPIGLRMEEKANKQLKGILVIILNIWLLVCELWTRWFALKVVLGKVTDGQFEIWEMFSAQKFKTATNGWQHDLSVTTLESTLTFNNHVNEICTVRKTDTINFTQGLPTHTKCCTPKVLRWLQMPFID